LAGAFNLASFGSRRALPATLSARPVNSATNLQSETWRLIDAFSGTTYDREGDELSALGLYVDLAPWNFHFLQLKKSSMGAQPSRMKEQSLVKVAVAGR
jgi:hypothetical protein